MAIGKTRSALFYMFAILLAGALLSLTAAPAQAQETVTPTHTAPVTEVIVRPAQLNDWRFALEAPEGSGMFVAGPAQPPLGKGSVEFTISARGAYGIHTAAYAGLPLSAISHLSYATYRSTFDPEDHTTINLQFDIDYDVEDENTTAQGRLVFEPYKVGQRNSGVLRNVWQNWEALASNSAWWATAEPGARYCAEESPCTWEQILKLFPRAAIAAEGGQVWLRAGNWWGRAVTASADALVIGVEGAQTRYDFEPETPCKESCYVDGALGNDAFGGDTPASAKRTLQAALVQVAPGGEIIVAAGTYSEALTLTKPVTLLGPNFDVCPHDPTSISQPNPARLDEAVLAPAGSVAFTLAAGVDDVTIAGFTVAAPATGGVVASGADDEFTRIVIRNNRFVQLANVAVASPDGWLRDWEIACNRSEDTGAGAIALTGGASERLTILENYLAGGKTQAATAAVVLENSLDVRVEGNTITGFGGDAIRLVNRALRGVVNDNTLANVGVGVHLLGVANATTNWLEQVYIEFNTITDVTTAAVLVDHTAGEMAGVIAELCICANTITQDVGLLAADATLIDLRLRETTEDPYGRIVVRETVLKLHGESVATAVHGLRVRGALHQLDVYQNTFDGGGVVGIGAVDQAPSSGVYLQTDDMAYGPLPSTAQVSLTDNLITGFVHGVTVFDPVRGVYGGLPEGASVQASANRIAGNRDFGARNGDGAELIAVDNWWGDAQGPSGAGPGAGDAVSANIAYCTWLNAPPPLGVAAGFVHNLVSRRDFCTISSALADEGTLDGHTLATDARVFVEQVTVSKSVTLTGSATGASIIRAPASLSPEQGGAIVAVTGAGVVARVSNFTIEGPGDGVCGTLRAGIAVQGGAQADIHDNVIRAIRNEPLQACAHGVGIAVGNSSLASPGTAAIRDNRITGYQKAGIVVSGAGAHATLTGNQIEGAGSTSVLVQNGVQVSYGATATITGNTITGHAFTPFSLVSTGILLYQADADTDGNTLRDNQVGIYLVDSSGVHAHNTVSVTAAALASPGYWGIIVDAPPPGRKPQLALAPQRAVRAPAASAQQTAELRGVQHVIVRANALLSDGGGVGLQADGGYGVLDIDLTATNNEIRGWGRGVNITQCAGSCSGASYRAATLRHNLIAENGAGFDNTSAGGLGIQASENWWGAPSGPATSRNPGGAGGALTGDAGFAPWLCSGVDADAAIGFQPEAAPLCGLAEQLVILTQPVGGLEGFPLPQQPVVRIQDGDGNLATNFNGPVTIAPAPGSSAVLGGGVTVYAVNGVAHFTDVRIDSYGEGVVLAISAPGLAPVASLPIAVTPQTGDITVRVEVVGQPPTEEWRIDGPTGRITLPSNGGEAALTDLHANETYTFALENKPGYTLAASCVAGASGSDSIDVALDYQAHVTCTFVATAQLASVTIRQVVVGQIPVIDWEFAGDFGVFSLPAMGGERQFSTPAGVYLVQSAARVSYSPAVVCTNGAGGGHQALLVLAPGEQVNCTFTASERTTALMLRKTVGLSAERCGVSDVVGVAHDTLVYYCYTILNTGEAPLSLHNLADSEAGPVLANLDYALAPGATVDTVTLGRVLSESVSATTVTDGVWTAATGEGPAAHDRATAAVNVLRAGISGVLTVGDAGVTCGGRNDLEVAQEGSVNYCVTLLNTGEVALQTHHIAIPGLGIDQQLDHLLAPGAFVRVTAAEIPALGGVTISATQAQTLTVQATNPPAAPTDAPQYLVAPEQFTAESVSTATVRLPEVDEDPITENRLYLPSVVR